MPKTLTIKQLKAQHACANQVALFHKQFGNSTTVTVAKCRKVADLFDWSWAASHLLSFPAYADYSAKLTPINADYNAKLASINADYNAKLAPIYADYYAKLAPIYADYDAK